MKKFLISIFSIISIIIILIIIDIVSIFTINKPLFALKEDKGNYIVYYGLLYNTYTCQSFTINQIKPKWQKYDCSLNLIPTYKIMDYDGPCAESLENIYSDEEYDYYLSCIKSDKIKIKFSNGNEYTLKEVLDKNILSIEDLIDKGLKVYKYSK